MRSIPTLLFGMLLAGATAQTGSPDPAFNGNGIAVIDISSASNDIAWDVAFQADGKAVIAGISGLTNQDFCVVRLNTDGSLDNGFGGDGKVTTEVGGANDRGRAVAIQADGKIVVAGHARPGGDDDFALVRYNTDGTLDNSFDGDGRVVTDIAGDDRALAVLIQPDGKILVCGQIDDGNSVRFGVARYDTDGTPDAGFGGGTGYTYASFAPTNNATAWDLALQPDGRIVVAGYASDGTYNDIAIARFHAYGTLDASFDVDGLVTVPVGTADDLAHAVEIQPDGKILIAGKTQDGSNDLFALVRLNDDGTLDASFDGDGRVTTSIEGYDEAYGLVLQPDGRIVLGGTSNTGSQRVFGSVRYETDGTLDISYDGDGMMSLPVGTSNDECFGAVLAPNGNIALVGYSDGANAADFVLVALLSGLNMGIVDLEAPSSTLFAYPNPVADQAMLQFELNHAARLDCKLFDEQGREVRSFFSRRRHPAGANQIALDLSGLTAGHYTVMLTTGAGAVSVRLMKQ